MLHLKIGPKRPVLPEEHDEMHRDWVGWEPGMSPQTIYTQNRGTWVLGVRASSEKYAAFSDTVEHRVRCVVELAGIEVTGKKKAIVGTVLGPGHPVHDALIGQDAPDHFRNPVTYPADPGSGPAMCACGCGEPVSGRAQFVAGHDQRAVHARIAAQWGSTVAFLEWFDATYGRPQAA
jgi:hypothetical protein